MYWASTSADLEYLFRYKDAPFLDPDEVLSQYTDWTDPLEWAYSERETTSYKRLVTSKATHMKSLALSERSVEHMTFTM